jgi:glutathione S-transferase
MLGVKAERQRGWTDLEWCKTGIERELGAGPYLLGDWFTAADVMIGSIFIWQRMMGNTSGRSAIDAYVDRLLARPKSIKLGAA